MNDSRANTKKSLLRFLPRPGRIQNRIFHVIVYKKSFSPSIKQRSLWSFIATNTNPARFIPSRTDDEFRFQWREQAIASVSHERLQKVSAFYIFLLIITAHATHNVAYVIHQPAFPIWNSILRASRVSVLCRLISLLVSSCLRNNG